MGFWGKSQPKISNEEKVMHAKLDAEVEKEAIEILLKMLLEEAKTPGTYPTEIGVGRIGEGAFLQIGKTVEAARNFINSLVLHRVQIMNISAKADKGMLDEYIVTFWGFKQEIVDEVINEIKIRKYNEAGVKLP